MVMMVLVYRIVDEDNGSVEDGELLVCRRR